MDIAFWMNGLGARRIQEIIHSPEALNRDGFWAIQVSYEGEWTCAKLDDVEEMEFPEVPWIPNLNSWKSSVNQQEYEKYVESIRQGIADGDVYQANACRILESEYSGGDLRGLFTQLLKNNPAPFAAYFKAGDLEIASASPERFLSIDSVDGVVRLKSSPIKGTSTTADFGEKDKAENVMIVDLMRNDLGEICASGTVDVTRLLGVEEHPGLFHLVSDVVGTLSQPLSSIHQILPAGSISGAPKSSAKKIIASHEGRRGPYCGLLGYIHREGEKVTGELSVGIRLFWREDGKLKFGSGAGITWASNASAEWDETELKARRLISIANGTFNEGGV